MGKAMESSCLISKPNTYEGRRDQLTCTGKEDSNFLAGKRKDILRRTLYYNSLIYTELLGWALQKVPEETSIQLPLTVI